MPPVPLSRPTVVGVASLVVALGVAGTALPATTSITPVSAEAAALTPGPPTAQLSWTAKILLPSAARRAPDTGARIAGRLMHYTAYSRRPNVLMVTGTFTEPGGREWVQVQLPKRPNRSTAWLPRTAVELQPVRTRIRVRLTSRVVEIVRNGITVKRFKAAVGTGGTPTPVGTFAVQDPVHASPSQRSYLGPYIITLTAYSPVLRTFMGGPGLIAIHGTSAPQLLGQAVSHGCIRVSNRSVAQLWPVVTPGMPVEITRT